MTNKKIQEGNNTLFADPDPDQARSFFKNKSRGLKNKVTTVEKAVAEYIHDNDYIAIGGFGANRIPTAVLHEIVRQGKKEMGFAGHTSTHDFQILTAGKCFNRCDIAYIIGLEARGLSPAARRYMESGEVEVTEWTNAAMSWRIKAAAMGLSFLPARTMLGTDTFTCSAAKKIECPYTGKSFTALPALYPDCAVIHVHECDIHGNARVYGASVSDQDLARASKHVILTTERIIPVDEIRSNPEKTFIPFWCVDAVIEVPFGSYPGNMPYEYYSDEEHLKEWITAEKDEKTYQAFLQEQIFSCKNFNQYLDKNGGLETMRKLRAIEFLIENDDRERT